MYDAYAHYSGCSTLFVLSMPCTYKIMHICMTHTPSFLLQAARARAKSNDRKWSGKHRVNKLVFFFYWWGAASRTELAGWLLQKVVSSVFVTTFRASLFVDLAFMTPSSRALHWSTVTALLCSDNEAAVMWEKEFSPGRQTDELSRAATLTEPEAIRSG